MFRLGRIQTGQEHRSRPRTVRAHHCSNRCHVQLGVRQHPVRTLPTSAHSHPGHRPPAHRPCHSQKRSAFPRSPGYRAAHRRAPTCRRPDPPHRIEADSQAGPRLTYRRHARSRVRCPPPGRGCASTSADSPPQPLASQGSHPPHPAQATPDRTVRGRPPLPSQHGCSRTRHPTHAIPAAVVAWDAFRPARRPGKRHHADQCSHPARTSPAPCLRERRTPSPTRSARDRRSPWASAAGHRAHPPLWAAAPPTPSVTRRPWPRLRLRPVLRAAPPDRRTQDHPHHLHHHRQHHLDGSPQQEHHPPHHRRGEQPCPPHRDEPPQAKQCHPHRPDALAAARREVRRSRCPGAR
jgi:hypothetical protein